MSQYSISIKSIINIESHNPPYNDNVFADVPKKIERGREIFFNYDYEGDAVFKELFEKAFILNYLDESIYCLDVDLFKLNLENDVKIKAPLFYNKYKAVQELKNTELAIGDIDTSSRQSQAQSDTSAESSSTGKSKTSQFPQDINTNNFQNVRYMDAGSISDNENESKSANISSMTETVKNSRNTDVINKLAYYMQLENNVISDFVKSFRDMFMGIW